MNRVGRVITLILGIPGSGKSTICAVVARQLEGLDGTAVNLESTVRVESAPG